MRIQLGRYVHQEDVVRALGNRLQQHYRSELAAGRSVNCLNTWQLRSLSSNHQLEAGKLNRITGLPINEIQQVIAQLRCNNVAIIPHPTVVDVADAASVRGLTGELTVSPRSVERPLAEMLVASSLVVTASQRAITAAAPKAGASGQADDWQQVDPADQELQEAQSRGWGDWVRSFNPFG